MAKFSCFFDAIKAAVLWSLDTYSDVSIIFAIMYSIDHIVGLRAKTESTDKHSELMKECKISNITELNEKLQVVENVLLIYIIKHE